jgi:hypothetical protein
LTQEELKARKYEESLFSELPKLPTILSNVAQDLDISLNGDTDPDNAKKSRLDK